MTWRPSKSLRECSGINRRNTVSCFVIHKYGNGKQRLLVPADPCASSQITQSQRVHTKERRTVKGNQCAGVKGSQWLAMEKGANRPPSPWLWLVTDRADLARVRIEGLCRRSIGGLAGFGLEVRDGVLEPIALAIHLQDMDMMGEAIEKSPCQTFVAKDPCPLVEG